jgi:hypothetical protein
MLARTDVFYAFDSSGNPGADAEERQIKFAGGIRLDCCQWVGAE